MPSLPRSYDPRKVRESAKIRIPLAETAASGAPHDGCAPLFETNLTETLGIRKFLVMSMEDLQDQVKRAAKDRSMHPKQFRAIKAQALLLTNWMTSALQMVDGMLGAAAQPEQETKQ
jgi:hypothetical protein